MSESEIRNCLWMTVGTCIFYLNNNNYFLIVDYYFRYFPIVKLEYMLASSVITHIKSYFARHDILSKVRSVSSEFRQFSVSSIWNTLWLFSLTSFRDVGSILSSFVYNKCFLFRMNNFIMCPSGVSMTYECRAHPVVGGFRVAKS